jgi:hypothetical protein
MKLQYLLNQTSFKIYFIDDNNNKIEELKKNIENIKNLSNNYLNIQLFE